MLEHDFKENLGYWVGMASRAFERALNEELAPHGITLRQCQVLGWLALEKELTLSQLADRLRIEPPTLVRILDRMERDGWVERHAEGRDRRKKLIRPTRRVQPVWEQMMACIRRVRARAIAGLDAVEVENTRRVLIAIQENLSVAIPTEELAT